MSVQQAITSPTGKDVNQSETSRYRSVLSGYCQGYGIDIGFGGDPITDSAIRVDFPQPYTETGDNQSVQLGGDCRNLRWFRDDSLDYVYSSHVLEDFDERETESVLREWTRVLKPGGSLVLLLPDQPRYQKYCQETGWPYNEHHSVEHFSLKYVEEVAARLGDLQCVSRHEELGPYSFGVVFTKSASSSDPTGVLIDLQRKLEKAWTERDDLKVRLNCLERHPVVLMLNQFRRIRWWVTWLGYRKWRRP